MRCFVRYATQRLLCTLLVATSAACGEVLPTHNLQGATHAYLLVKTEDGKVIGVGDSENQQVGRVWRSRLTLRFRDGSIDDDTTLYTQGRNLHVISDHHVQKGPSFPRQLDMTVNTAARTVTWHDVHDGKDEVKTETMEVPDDLMNGMMPWVLQNLPRGATETKMSYVVAAPKPRVVKLAIHPDGTSRFRLGYASKSAQVYRIHVELGGVAGVVAPVIGRAPADMHAYVVSDEVPTFLKFNTYLYQGGPMLNIELTGPGWPELRE